VTMLAVAPTSGERTGAQPSLAELVSAVWAQLMAGASTVCPVCRGEMVPEHGQHGRPLGGRCTRCGARLS
jgi:tRNA(Ile2) C34 agmatinyltransferase TiaS